MLRLNDLVAKSNQAYIDSEIAITVRLVTALPVAYTETNSNDTPLDEMRLAQGVFMRHPGVVGASLLLPNRPVEDNRARVTCPLRRTDDKVHS